MNTLKQTALTIFSAIAALTAVSAQETKQKAPVFYRVTEDTVVTVTPYRAQFTAQKGSVWPYSYTHPDNGLVRLKVGYHGFNMPKSKLILAAPSEWNQTAYANYNSKIEFLRPLIARENNKVEESNRAYFAQKAKTTPQSSPTTSQQGQATATGDRYPHVYVGRVFTAQTKGVFGNGFLAPKQEYKIIGCNKDANRCTIQTTDGNKYTWEKTCDEIPK